MSALQRLAWVPGLWFLYPLCFRSGYGKGLWAFAHGLYTGVQIGAEIMLTWRLFDG